MPGSEWKCYRAESRNRAELLRRVLVLGDDLSCGLATHRDSRQHALATAPKAHHGFVSAEAPEKIIDGQRPGDWEQAAQLGQHDAAGLCQFLPLAREACISVLNVSRTFRPRRARRI